MSCPSQALREAAEGTGLSFTLAAELPWPPWMNSVKCQDAWRPLAGVTTRQLPQEARLSERADARGTVPCVQLCIHLWLRI